jgi:hypothetical protein
MSHISRRGFLKGAAAGAGLAMGTRLGGLSWLGEARAAVEQPAVVVIHFLGGYNAIWGSAASFVTPLVYDGSSINFGVSATNFTNFGGASSPGGGVTMDNVIANTLSPFSKTHVAQIGVSNMIAAHFEAQSQLYTQGTQSAPLFLADAMGGTASIKAACIGDVAQAVVDRQTGTNPVNGVSLQTIRDMQSTISALGGSAPDPRMPDRAKAAIGLAASQGMSKGGLKANPVSEASLAQGYPAIVSTLQAPLQTFSAAELQTAYGLGTTTAISEGAGSLPGKLAGAELMVRAGTNVVLVYDSSTGWDTHGDDVAMRERVGMATYVVKPLNTFLDRMLNVTGHNVVVALVGDFARALPGSGHSTCLSATVFGKYCVNGTTGTVAIDGNTISMSAPGVSGLWAYLAAAAHIPTVSAFGANPHGLVA